LKSKDYWTYYSDSYTGTDDYGFSALPGDGRHNSDGMFGGNFGGDVGNRGYWWTATEGDASSAYYRSMYYDYNIVGDYDNNKSGGDSVRCVED